MNDPTNMLNEIASLENRIAALEAENERLREALAAVSETILKIDWGQVVLNRAEPCCQQDEEDSSRICGRAKAWAGHPSQHRFVGLYITARRLTAEALKGEKT